MNGFPAHAPVIPACSRQEARKLRLVILIINIPVKSRVESKTGRRHVLISAVKKFWKDSKGNLFLKVSFSRRRLSSPGPSGPGPGRKGSDHFAYVFKYVELVFDKCERSEDYSDGSGEHIYDCSSKPY